MLVSIFKSGGFSKKLETFQAKSAIIRRLGGSRTMRAGMPELRTCMETGRAVTIRAIILGSALFLSLTLFAQEKKDVLVMKNGDRFKGEIKGLDSGMLRVDLDYVDGTLSVQWSQVANLESDRLFLIQTESGQVYTGKLTISGVSNDPPVKIEIAAAPKNEAPKNAVPESEVEVARSKIIKLNQTAEAVWSRFNGAIDSGFLYSKGNESAQYNFSSQVAYDRERWSAQASYNSSLSSNSGSPTSTRNQIDLSSMKLLRRNNWFYAGSASFLQSAVQEITLQTTLSGGIGRYLKNTNRASIYLLGGLGWQNVAYTQNTPDQGKQNIAVAFVSTEIKAFKFKKTNLDVTASLLPAITDAGRIHFNTNAVYYLKIYGDLKWNFSFYGSWDSRPPPTLRGSDYGTSSGLSWSFGNR